jgi:hypothetical protein
VAEPYTCDVDIGPVDNTPDIERYGFAWGPMIVERSAHIEGRGYILTVKTDHARVEVYVTEKGRKINVYAR